MKPGASQRGCVPQSGDQHRKAPLIYCHPTKFTGQRNCQQFPSPEDSMDTQAGQYGRRCSFRYLEHKSFRALHINVSALNWARRHTDHHCRSLV